MVVSAMREYKAGKEGAVFQVETAVFNRMVRQAE